MPDKRFFITHDAIAIADALKICGAAAPSVVPNGVIRQVASLGQNGGGGSVVFAEKPAAVTSLDEGEFALCLATEKAAAAYNGEGFVAICVNPRLGFSKLAAKLYTMRTVSLGAGIDPAAQISPDAVIHSTAIIGANASIGPRTSIGPGTVIGPGVEVGADCNIGAGVTIFCALLGASVVIKPGARLGQSGFGFVPSEHGFIPTPQLGRLVIGDQVEIGANSTVDRGALDDTSIGSGTKIDNLVQIGHNVVLGKNCIVAGTSGIAGSVKLGDNVIIGGQVGLAGHLEVGDNVQIAGGAGVMHNIPAGQKWGGLPARPVKQWFREAATVARITKQKKEAQDET